jgi:hypothetical protein
MLTPYLINYFPLVFGLLNKLTVGKELLCMLSFKDTYHRLLAKCLHSARTEIFIRYLRKLCRKSALILSENDS